VRRAFHNLFSLSLVLGLLCCSCGRDERHGVGKVSNIEIWYRKTSTRDNASDTYILRFRTQAGDFCLRQYAANYDTTPAGFAKGIESTVSAAIAKQKIYGSTPVLALRTTAFCYSDGKEYGRQGWAIFYPDDTDQPEDVYHGLTWDKYPAIFANGFMPTNEVQGGDTLVTTLPLNWPGKWILHRDISHKTAATGP
jgi:hypothetical protein